MQIRNATIDDIWVIKSISQVVWPDTYADILTKEQIVYMLNLMYDDSALRQQIEINNHTFLLASDEGEYLGFISFELNYKQENSAKIHKFYVLPSIQNKGIGKRLLNEVEKIASENNNASLILNMNRENKALGFYERMGFEIIGEEDINIGSGFLMKDFVLSKKLSVS